MRLRAYWRTFVTFGLFGVSAFGQHLDFGFGFGVKGGFPFTEVLETTGVSSAAGASLNKSDSYIVGPVAEMRIPFGFAVEADGLYRKAEYNLTTNGITTRLDASAWEIPYLAKFRFPIPLLKPFISGGGAYRTFTSLPANVTPTHNALVLGGGLELRIKRMRLSGEARWLYWGSSSDVTVVRLSQSQGEFLFGLIF